MGNVVRCVREFAQAARPVVVSAASVLAYTLGVAGLADAVVAFVGLIRCRTPARPTRMPSNIPNDVREAMREQQRRDPHLEKKRAELQNNLEAARSNATASSKDAGSYNAALECLKKLLQRMTSNANYTKTIENIIAMFQRHSPSSQANQQSREDDEDALMLRLRARQRLGIDTIGHYNFAFVGDTGSGKSSLINALRGIRDGTDGAAGVDENESTQEITPYPFLENASIVLWDVPGARTLKHAEKDYYFENCLYAFDCLVIVIATRFREIDIQLAKDAHRYHTPFIFVRSKSDQDIDSKRDRTPKMSAEEAAEQLRCTAQSTMQTQLTSFGLGEFTLYFVSSRAFKDNSKEYKMDEEIVLLYVVSTGVVRSLQP